MNLSESSVIPYPSPLPISKTIPLINFKPFICLSNVFEKLHFLMDLDENFVLQSVKYYSFSNYLSNKFNKFI